MKITVNAHNFKCFLIKLLPATINRMNPKKIRSINDGKFSMECMINARVVNDPMTQKQVRINNGQITTEWIINIEKVKKLIT